MNKSLSLLIGLAMMSAYVTSNAEDKPPVDANTIIEALKPAPPPVRTRNLMIRSNAPADVGSSANVNTDSAPPAPTSAPSVATAPAVVAPPAAKPEISLAIPFEFNSSKISPEGTKALDELGKALGSNLLAGLKFSLEGHTDAKGSAAYNMKLSQARADEVRRYLTATHGIDGARLATLGKGATELAKPNEPLSAENRRVRIITLNN